LALMLAFFALAQRYGEYRSKLLARCLNLIAAAILVAWCFWFLPNWIAWSVSAISWSVILWFTFLWVQAHQNASQRGPRPETPNHALLERIRQQEHEIDKLTNQCSRAEQERDGARQRIADVERESGGQASKISEQDTLIKELSDAAETHGVMMRQWHYERPILAAKATQLEDWQAVSERFWKLKTGARMMRRRWPGSAFEHHPAAKTIWASALSNDQEVLSAALEWHESFESLINFNNAYVRSLDLDGIMELLDLEERRHRGVMPPRLLDSRPIVGPERYGFRTNNDGHKFYGFYIANYGSSAAFHVTVHMLRLGRDRVRFVNTIRTLSKEQGPIFCEQQITTNEGGNASVGRELFDSIRDWQADVDVHDAPIHLWISYRDSGGTCYMSNSEILPNPVDAGNSHINAKHLFDEIVPCGKGD